MYQTLNSDGDFMTKPIHFFCAGGTIDKIYFDAKSDYQIGEPAVIKMLDEMPVHFDYEVTSLLKKDSLEMGLAAAQAPEADSKSIIEGADLTVKMLTQVFEKNNILEVNPVDEKFDPEFHQAMSMQEVEGVPANTVTGVMQKGYTLNERLVRPALVMVAK